MRFFPLINSLAAVAFLSQTALAINPVHHPFLKRQGCNNIDSECSTVGTTLSECVSYVCDSCTSIDAAIPTCCTLSTNIDIATCIEQHLPAPDSSASSFIDDSSSTAALIGPSSGLDSTGTAAFPATTALIAENPACLSLSSKIEDCDSSTVNWAYNTLWTTQASCACYAGSSFQPSSWDNYYSSCLDFLYTADSSLYYEIAITSDNTIISTPCAEVGNVKATIATASATRNAGSGGGAGNSRTTANTLPTATTPRPVPAGVTAGTGEVGNVAGGVESVPLKSALALLASFVAVLYLL
ncbi:MAG: hypothetical protein L6R39_005427 [Caloplaca ligustica]|nr:MAG: hypothetical protein L6R39_005427 [Caloplaca ligustica]